MRSSDWSSDVCSSDLTQSSAYSGDSWVAQTIALPNNVAPNAPVLTAPADGSTIDRNITQRFALTASDPDPGDSTSQTYWRHRLTGAASWTEVVKANPNTYYDFPAGTFTAGDYERSEERRVGKECVSTGRSRGSPDQ